MKSLKLFPRMGSFLGHGHHNYKPERHQINVHHAGAHHFSPLMVASAIAVTVLAMLCLAGVGLIVVHFRHKLFR